MTPDDRAVLQAKRILALLAWGEGLEQERDEARAQFDRHVEWASDETAKAEAALAAERERAKILCPDCDHGVRGGSPCETCAGSGYVLVWDRVAWADEQRTREVGQMSTAIAAERERCAQVVEDYVRPPGVTWTYAEMIAQAIRSEPKA